MFTADTQRLLGLLLSSSPPAISLSMKLHDDCLLQMLAIKPAPAFESFSWFSPKLPLRSASTVVTVLTENRPSTAVYERLVDSIAPTDPSSCLSQTLVFEDGAFRTWFASFDEHVVTDVLSARGWNCSSGSVIADRGSAHSQGFYCKKLTRRTSTKVGNYGIHAISVICDHSTAKDSNRCCGNRFKRTYVYSRVKRFHVYIGVKVTTKITKVHNDAGERRYFPLTCQKKGKGGGGAVS